jgi:hypothetical protein
LQLAPVLWAVSHFCPQPAQFVIDDSELSHPSVSGGVALQSAQPEAQPLYVQFEMDETQIAPVLCTVSQLWPQPPQLEAETGVSHPFVSGGVVSQSAHPGAQLLYWQVVPLHAGPTLCCVSHASPHAPQLDTVERDVSQPLVSGPASLQWSQPDAQPRCVQVAPEQPTPRL